MLRQTHDWHLFDGLYTSVTKLDRKLSGAGMGKSPGEFPHCRLAWRYCWPDQPTTALLEDNIQANSVFPMLSLRLSYTYWLVRSWQLQKDQVATCLRTHVEMVDRWDHLNVQPRALYRCKTACYQSSLVSKTHLEQVCWKAFGPAGVDMQSFWCCRPPSGARFPMKANASGAEGMKGTFGTWVCVACFYCIVVFVVAVLVSVKLT